VQLRRGQVDAEAGSKPNEKPAGLNDAVPKPAWRLVMWRPRMTMRETIGVVGAGFRLEVMGEV
jgi:hypothetical protein